MGKPRSWAYSFTYNQPATVKSYGDNAGNTYTFGTYFGLITIGGNHIGVYNDNTHYMLIKFDTIGVPQWAISTIGTKISVNDSGYCYVAGADSIAKYTPGGLLAWARPGGGTKIFSTEYQKYYVVNGTSVKKFADNGNLLWQVSGIDFERTSNNRLFLNTGVSIHELSPATGAIINTFPNYAGSINFYDKQGGYYKVSDSSLTKYNATGMEWKTSLTGANFNFSGIDSSDFIHFGTGYSTHVFDNNYDPHPVNLFIPPSLIINPPGLDIFHMQFSTEYIIVGRINPNQPVNPAITTGEIKAICKESTTDIPFTVNSYITAFTNGFRAELSDSTGSFTNPLTLGTRTYSPIIASTPFFNISGNGYRVRVVADVTGITGSESPVNQFATAPAAIFTMSNECLTIPNSCAPLTMSLQPPGNYTYVWDKRPYEIIDYLPINTNSIYTNDSLTLTSADEDDYRVKVTDTTTNCYSFVYKNNVHISATLIKPDFTLPDTICIHAGPVEIYNNYENGLLSGSGMYDNIFYPDSAGYGLHAINLHVANLPSCYAYGDTTKYIYVDSCFGKINTVDVLPHQNGYCAGDTIQIFFDYDAALFDSTNVFKVQLGYYSYPSYNLQSVIATGTSSPITCVIPDLNYWYRSDYRIRIKSTSPVITGSVNSNGNLRFDKITTDFTLSLNDSLTNCGNPGSVIKLNGYGRPDFIYKWNLDSAVYVDTSASYGTSYFFATYPGNYAVEIESAFGCNSYSDTMFVGNSGIAPVANLTSSALQLCPGDSILITLTTDTINTVLWYRNLTLFQPADPYNFYISDDGTYEAVVYNAIGCYLDKSIYIVSHPAFTTSITTDGNTTTFCLGDSLKLMAGVNIGSQCLWYKDGLAIIPSATSSYIYVQYPGSYSVRYTNQYGCSSFTAPVLLSTFPRPSASLPSDSVHVCTGNNLVIPVTLQGTPPFQLKIKKGNTTVYTDNNITSNTAQVTLSNPQTNMYYFITSQNYCTERDTDSVYVKVDVPPVVQATPQGLNYVCRGDSLLLHTTPASGYFYQWYKDNLPIGGAVSSQKYVKNSGGYKVVVTDSVCTVTSNTLTVVSLCDPHNNPGKAAGSVDESAAFDIYPNPAGTYLTLWLKHKDAQHGLVKIYNLLSQEMLVQPFYMALDEDELRLDVSMLGKGVYFFYLQTETNSSYTRKFIIE